MGLQAALRNINEHRCGVKLPHTDEEVQMIPRQVMPTLKFPEPNDPETRWTMEMENRVKNLAADVNKTRAETKQLQQRLELKRAQFEAGQMARRIDYGLSPQPIIHEIPQIDELKKTKSDLAHCKFLLADARNQMHSLRQEISTYKRLLQQELGDGTNLHALITSGYSSGWTGRAQQIQNLKLKNAALQSQLQEYQHKLGMDPLYLGPYDPRHTTCVEDFVPKTQRKVLRKIYQDRKNKLLKNEREVSDFVEEFETVSLMYKAALARNKVLMDEMRSLKEQCMAYEVKTQEDNELIESLMAHQMQMREMLDRETHLAEMTLRRSTGSENEMGDRQGSGAGLKGSDKQEKFDSQKYKTLWEASESEKQGLEDMVSLLQKRLDDVTRQVVEAEKHCADNQSRSQELNKQLDVMKTASKSTHHKGKDHKSKTPSKAKKIPSSGFLATYEQLQAVRAENTFLRDFLRRAIMTKEEDFKLYQFSMNSARQQYLRAIEELKGEKQFREIN